MISKMYVSLQNFKWCPQSFFFVVLKHFEKFEMGANFFQKSKFSFPLSLAKFSWILAYFSYLVISDQ